MIKDYSKLAFNNLKKRGLRSWLTMIGIFIGIAAIVSLISLGNGLENAVIGQFGQLNPDTLTVQNAETGFGPPGSTAVQKLTEHDLKIIERVRGVNIVVPRLIRIVEINYNKVSEFKYVVNVPEDRAKREMVYDEISLSGGRLITSDDSRSILVGGTLAEAKGFGKPLEISSTVRIQNENFRVAGIIEKTGSFIQDDALLMMENDLKRVLNIEDEFDLFLIKVSDLNEIEFVAERVEDALRKDRRQKPGEEDFTVNTPLESLQSIKTILTSINIVILSIAGIALFVGGVGITNTMYTSVLERTKEIGVMKAVGARNSNILSLFLIESGFLGLVGGIIGALFGLSFAFLAAFGVASAFPGINFGVEISYSLLFGAIGFSFVVGTISGILPAIQASQLKPVDALRK